jgi:transcriptional regulator with XRE-family HTH domain
MTNTIAHRLKVARSLAGLSQEALRQRLGGEVSRYMLAKWERGEGEIDEAQLLQLAEALQVKPDYLMRPLSVAIERVSFRKKASIGKQEQARLIFRAVAEEVITMSKAANLRNQKLAAFKQEMAGAAKA